MSMTYNGKMEGEVFKNIQKKKKSTLLESFNQDVTLLFVVVQNLVIGHPS